MNKQISANYPLITIGILTYNNIITQFNCEKIIRRALDCFSNQDYPNLEIIIQDDCSTDNTLRVCKEYAETYPFIKVLKNEKNLGVDKNISSLIEKVNGEFFLWGCMDDIYEKNYITKCYMKLKSNPEKSVCQSYIKTVYQGKEVLEYYEDIDCPITVKKIHEINQILFKRENYLGKCSALNPLIHGLIKTRFLKLIFRSAPLLLYELSIPIILIWVGGLCVVDEVLFINDAKQFFKVRYPESYFTKKSTNNFYILLNGLRLLLYFIKIYFNKDIKVGFFVIIKTWWNLFCFYFLREFSYVIKNKMKVYFFNFVKKYFPSLLSLYRFFKKRYLINKDS